MTREEPSPTDRSAHLPADPSASLPADLDAALVRFARQPRIVVATDFDGVLAPLVRDPAAARPLPGTIAALTTLASSPHTDVVIVSGRALATLATLSGNPRGVTLIGSHGAESTDASVCRALPPSADAETDAHRLEQLGEHIEGLARRHPRARIERKPHALVVHTRGLSPDEEVPALADAQELGGSLSWVRVVPGKSVVELTVSRADKGSALTALAADRQADAVLYLGDDRTDEDAFVRLRGLHDVSIKVGRGSTAARYRIADPAAVGIVLDRLLTLRAAG